MNKSSKLITIGNKVFDYMVLSILLNLSLLTVIPFISVIVGMVAYFNTDENERSLSIIFITIKNNINMIFKVTILYVIVLGAIILNLYVIEHDIEQVGFVIKGISYIGIFILLNIVVNGPIILLKMNVTLCELLVNCVFLIFGNIKNYLLIVGMITMFIYGITYSYLLLIFGIYFVVLITAKLTYRNFIKLKEKTK